MTPAQDEALKKAWDLLSEHFEHVLLVVDFEVVSGDAHECWWHGGALTAIGMAEFAKDRLLHSNKPRFNEPE